jgi:hypothetical protein
VFTTLGVPVKVAVWVPAASTTLSVPVVVPTAVGEKVTLMVQVLLAATLAPQVLVSEKGALTVMLETESAAAVELVNVTDWAALAEPTMTPVKVRLLGRRVVLGAAPVKLTVCGLPLPLSLMVREPVNVPGAVGVNVTVIVQLLSAASLEEHVLFWAKTLVVVEMPVKTSAAVPELAFVTVTV